MKTINYGLIISDYDGTLLKSDGTISDRTRESIRRFVENGGHFAVSTGRTPAGILPQVRELGLKGVVACGQGASIVEIESGKMLLDGRMDKAKALTVCKKMEEMGLHIHVYEPWGFSANKDNDGLKAYEKIVNVKATVIQDKPMSQFLEESSFIPSKFAALVAAEDRDRVYKELESYFQGVDCYVTSSSIFLVEVGNNKYTKGTAVQFLSDYYQVPLEKIICVGDQLNDLTMLKAAGLGLAVKNADDGLKKETTVFDYTNDEDAICEIIEKFGYTKE